MRTFNHFNKAGGAKCPICNTSKNEPVILAGITGTEKGGNVEAVQVHLECIELLYYKDEKILAMKF